MGYQPQKQIETEVSRQLITGKKDLRAFFENSFKKPEEVVIGMEVEKQGIYHSNYKPVSYLGNNGVRKIQERFIQELNWQIERQEEKYIVSLSRGSTHLNLEVSESIWELAGRTHPSIHDLARELRIHQNELAELSRLHDVVWLGIGIHPFATVKELRTLPLKRYDVWSDSARKRRVSRALLDEDTKKSASIQASIDYTSEDDMHRKSQILLRLAPFLTAMYAHSPLRDGKDSGFVSLRTHFMQHMDRRRYGIRKIFFSKNFGIDEWINFVLKMPMVAIFREEKWIPVKNLTFNQFLKSGYSGYLPTLEDWILQISFIYTDMRIRSNIELRICDSLPPALIPSMQAIVKAFVYHPDGLSELQKLTKKWNFHDFVQIYEPIARRGLQAESQHGKLLDYCKEILNLATENLRTQKILNEKQQDESIYLDPMKEFVFIKEKSPGQYLIEEWNNSWKQNPERVIEWCAY